MTIAAVVIEKYIVGIRDSKDMSPAGRERAAKSILRGAVAYEISVKDAKEIDNVGVDQATKDAMEEAIASVLHQLDRKELLDSSRIVTFVDGLLHPDTILTRLTTSSQFHLEVISLPKADKYVFQTSCAGIRRGIPGHLWWQPCIPRCFPPCWIRRICTFLDPAT